jgi:capsular polysaccharide biosynthesis protein
MNRKRRTWTLTGAIRHHAAALILIIAVAVAGAGAAVVLRPATYQGSALLFLDTRSSASQGFDVALQTSQLLSAHYVQIATTEPVLASACTAYKSAGYTCTADSLSRRVSANTVKGTTIIAINAQARDPQSAAALANSVADAVVKESQNEVDALVKSTADYLDSELKQLSDQIANRQAVITQYINDQTPNGRAQTAQAQSQLPVLQGQYTSVYQKKQDLTLSQNQLKGTLTVFQRALPPLQPADPDPLLYVSAGLVGGIILGLLLVVLLERFDDRLFSVDDLVEATGSPLGLSIPTKALAADPGQQARHYALARAYLHARRPDLRCLVVAAASARDRAQPVAMGLGAVAARAGQRVLVVAAEDPGMEPPFSASPSHNYGYGQQELEQIRSRGRSRPKAPEARANLVAVAAGSATEELLAGGSNDHDLVIVASGPPFIDATGIYLAREAEFAVLVATARSTTFRDAQRSAETLQRAGIDVFASVLIGGGPPQSKTRVSFEDELLIPRQGTSRPMREESAGPTAS